MEIRNCRDAFREPALNTDRLGDVVPVCEIPQTPAFLSEQLSNGNAPLLETPQKHCLTAGARTTVLLSLPGV